MIDINLQGKYFSDEDHKLDILRQGKGWNKFCPHIGVGMIEFIESDVTPGEIELEVRKNLILDGLTVNKVEFKNNKIGIDASY